MIADLEPHPAMKDPGLPWRGEPPLPKTGGIEAFVLCEVLPYAPDAWYVPESVNTGYEISFTRYFYEPQPLRMLDEIRAGIVALEQETEGLLAEKLGVESLKGGD